MKVKQINKYNMNFMLSHFMKTAQSPPNCRSCKMNAESKKAKIPYNNFATNQKGTFANL